MTFQPNHWHKVDHSPPTYFPKGVPADHPTAFSDGSWVFTGDKAKTRYFIPLHGVASKSLKREAMARRTPEKQRKLDKEREIDRGIRGAAKDLATGFVDSFDWVNQPPVELVRR